MNIEPISTASQILGDLSIASLDGPLMQPTSEVSSVFMEKIQKVDDSLKNADILAEKYMNGESIPVHNLIIAMGKAKTELQLIVEVRNRVLEAYQEITKMQL